MAKKVMVVDDEPGFVELLTDILKAKEYDVISASDGREAVKRIGKEMPDLVILDVKMPKMNGYEVCKILRDDKLYGDIPIIMLTALNDLEEIKTGMSLGAVSYISKPFEQNTLLTMIHGLIGPAV